MSRLIGIGLLLLIAVFGLADPLVLQHGVSLSGQPTATPTPQPQQAQEPAAPVPSSTRPENSASDTVSTVSLKPRPRQEVSGNRLVQTPVGLPRTLTIPSIGVNARFEYVGLTAEGAMDVPRDPTNVAWYLLGPRPGENGNAVIAGHVDWGGKTAVFWGLRDLRPGDEVEVTTADEKHFLFIVRSLHWYDADSPAVAEVFGQADDPEVTLITCGGDFDRQTRQYLSRLVVRASLR